MSYWNHRVLAIQYKNEVFFQIYEVLYNDDNMPNGYIENPISIGSESIEGIKWQINRIKECLKKPILWAGDKFPQEYKPNKNG